MRFRTSLGSSNECHILMLWIQRANIACTFIQHSQSRTFRLCIRDLDQEVNRRRHDGDNQLLDHPGTAS